jgi:hypothetical protein
MNKIKATMAEMRSNYRILGVGYCDMQHLLAYQTPVAYSAGVYGWSCDYYEVKGVIISTGYSHLATKNMVDDYALIKSYEAKARLVHSREETNALLIELLWLLRIKED